jgi:hypothetical protein
VVACLHLLLSTRPPVQRCSELMELSSKKSLLLNQRSWMMSLSLSRDSWFHRLRHRG